MKNKKDELIRWIPEVIRFCYIQFHLFYLIISSTAFENTEEINVTEFRGDTAWPSQCLNPSFGKSDVFWYSEI